MVDRLALYQAPSIIGGDGLPAVAAMGTAILAAMPRFARGCRDAGGVTISWPSSAGSPDRQMFTGIITAIGHVKAVSPLGEGRDMRLTIGVPAAFIAGTALGASIACSGCCLTATDLGPDWFAVEVSAETLDHTAIGQWALGTHINLERSLRMGDELGGHLVSGHVDAVGRIAALTPENGSLRLTIEVPPPLHRFIAEKGSVAVGRRIADRERNGRLALRRQHHPAHRRAHHARPAPPRRCGPDRNRHAGALRCPPGRNRMSQTAALTRVHTHEAISPTAELIAEAQAGRYVHPRR